MVTPPRMVTPRPTQTSLPRTMGREVWPESRRGTPGVRRWLASRREVYSPIMQPGPMWMPALATRWTPRERTQPRAEGDGGGGLGFEVEIGVEEGVGAEEDVGGAVDVGSAEDDDGDGEGLVEVGGEGGVGEEAAGGLAQVSGGAEGEADGGGEDGFEGHGRG